MKESTRCSNSEFGDPLKGTKKACFCDMSPILDNRLEYCAKEGERCECSSGSQIYYGAAINK